MAYANDVRLLENLQAVLARTNSKQVLTFDPVRMALVGKNALRLVQVCAVPVAYEPSSDVKEGYYAWRIVPVAACRLRPFIPSCRRIAICACCACRMRPHCPWS